MGMYRCNHCDRWKHKNDSPPMEDPRDDLELICEECSQEIDGLAELQQEGEDGLLETS